MAKNNIKSKKGFTIIEVVLVLAVAGLIFMMVFLALPALQRSQRDTQRRDQLSGLVTQITQYQANNRNKLPELTGNSVTITPSDDGTIPADQTSGWANFYRNYILAGGDVFEDPNGVPYRLQVVKCGVTSGNCTIQRSTASFEGASTDADGKEVSGNQDYRVLITLNSQCDGETIVYNSGARRLTVAYKLEGGGTFCQGN